jgi:ABC-type Co2+ transport system permease subunit
VPVGVMVVRLLPGWSNLVRDLGAGGAWTVLIISQFIYAWVIGIATFAFLKLLEKLDSQGSVFGAGLSAAITVTVVNILSVWRSVDFGGYLIFGSAWVTWVVNYLIFLLMKVLDRSRQPI